MSRRVSRRHFLQATGSTLAALGWSQIDVMGHGDRYGRALAQSTPRKLALLVGINDYPEDGLFPPLYGCVNDVELQYHLLVHRFGFKPSDIVRLTDQQATRQEILNTFEEHLIKQAKPGDVVVFHFSGHGSRVADPDRDFPDGLNGTLVPVDSLLPEGFPRVGGPVQDITGHTLFLLGSALATENFTMVLDSCHSGGAQRGNLIIRSREGGSSLTMSDAELAYQEQWLARLAMSPETFISRRREGIAQGVAIASAKRDQFAADAPFEDFHAGAFTYVLTQYLWQQTGTTDFSSTLGNVGRTTTQVSFSAQEPQFETQPGRAYGGRPVYFTPKSTPPAEAVVTNIQGGEAEIWLGGVDPRSLAAFEQGAVLAGVDGAGQAQGLVEITERQGLTGRGRLLATTLPSGALLQEQVRGVPTDVTLRIGLDQSLGNEQSAALEALSAISRIEPMALGQGEAHYLLGRITAAYREELAGQANLPPEGSVGLFSQGLDLVPGSYGAPGEAVPEAIMRLRPKLRSLLAARIVKLTLNPGSSRLAISATMIPEGSNQLGASTFTIRGGHTDALPPALEGEQFALGTKIQFQIHNRETRDLYLGVLVIDATGEMSVIFPNQWTASSEVTLLPAGQTMSLPDPSRDSFSLVTQEPKGSTEVLIVASSRPLDHALRALQGVATRSGVAHGPMGIDEPTEVVDGLLQDLSNASPESDRSASIQPVSVTELAALSITFNII
ncbi:MAG: caspase family protein [Cyanobacteria bacterium J06639_14]